MGDAAIDPDAIPASAAGADSAAPAISAEVPDWSREAVTGWSPARSLLATIRQYQALPAGRRGVLSFLRRSLLVLRHRFWSAVTGADIPLNVQIGGGLLLPHPNGVVVHPHAVIGPNCLLFQQVTVGATQAGVPRIGGHVDIGAGAKVIGPVTLGAHVVVGANAVVTSDVPAGSIVAGVPARVIGQTGEAAAPAHRQLALRLVSDDHPATGTPARRRTDRGAERRGVEMPRER